MSQTTENVLLKFSASWCVPCKKLQDVIDNINLCNWNLKLKTIDVDDDENDELVSKYEVQSLPTLIFLKNGTPEYTMIGLNSKNEIETLFNQIYK